jgi:glycosyltransferase 2 family protein
MWKRILIIVIGIALFLLVLLSIDRQKTWEILEQADWKLCLLSLAVFVLMIYIKGIRWSYLLKMQGYHYSVWNCFLVYMASMYWGNITPGRAGDFVKVLYLKEDLKLPTGLGMANVLVDRVLDLYLLLVLGGLGILVNPMPADPASVKMVLAVKVFFVILVIVTFLAFSKKIGGILLKAAFQRLMKQEHREKTDKLFEDFHEGMAAFYKPAFLVPILLSFLAYAAAFGGCFLLAQSIHLNVSIFYLIFSISVVNIVSLLSFMGLGTRDVALQKLFGLVSITKEPAEAYSLLLFFVGTALFTLICFFPTLWKPVRLKSPE